MNQILDLLPITRERDFPVGQMEVRRDALVAAIVTAQKQGRTPVRAVLAAARHRVSRAWLAVIAAFLAAVALTFVGLSGDQHRVNPATEAVAVAAGVAPLVALFGGPSIREGGSYGGPSALADATKRRTGVLVARSVTP